MNKLESIAQYFDQDRFKEMASDVSMMYLIGSRAVDLSDKYKYQILVNRDKLSVDDILMITELGFVYCRGQFNADSFSMSIRIDGSYIELILVDGPRFEAKKRRLANIAEFLEGISFQKPKLKELNDSTSSMNVMDILDIVIAHKDNSVVLAKKMLNFYNNASKSDSRVFMEIANIVLY